MEKILAFLVDNWQVLSIGLVVLVDTILLLFHRNKVVDNSLLHDIYVLMLEAESKYGKGNGEKKFAYVLANYNFSLHPEVSISKIKSTIEYLLIGPTKKGGFGREETE